MAIGTESAQQLAEQLIKLTRPYQAEQLGELWIGNVAAVPATPAFIKEWLGAMRRANALEQAQDLIVLLLEDRLDNGKPKAALRVLLTVLPVFPAAEPLRPLLIRAIQAFQGNDVPQQEELIHAAGLDSKPNLVEAYQAYSELVKLTPGQVWQHYDWGVGLVNELDLDARKVTLAFPKEPGKVMTADGVRQFLKYIEPGNFLARRTKEPETLRQLGEREPAGLVREALASQDGKQIKQSDLKALFTEGFFTPEEWNSWWNKAREALKLDPMIDFDAAGGARAMIKLREKARTFDQELEEQFFASDSTLAIKTELIRQLAKRGKEAGLPITLLERMGKRLGDDWKLAESAAQKLEVAYMFADLAAAAPGAAIPQQDESTMLNELRDYTALTDIDSVEYGIRALTALLERDGDEGCRQAAELLPKAPVKLAQAIWKSLDQEHHIDLAVGALQKLLERPLENPETYAWAVRAILEGTWEHLSDYFPVGAITIEVLDEMERWNKLALEKRGDNAAVAKSLVSKMRTLLQADKFEAISKAVSELNRDGANRLRRQIQVNNALPETFKSQAERYILLTRNDLEDTAALSGTVATNEDLHLCTARTYTEKAAELRDIASVQIPQNSKVIEEARMEGDLKENAGYQYAKEKQKMLLQQQATLAALLQRAKILHPSEIDITRVGFGTRFTARNDKSGQSETYTLLGRWEANTERNILSVQAPLAEQFTGKGVGDTLEIQHPGGGSTPYEIEAIENALQDTEWTAEEAGT